MSQYQYPHSGGYSAPNQLRWPRHQSRALAARPWATRLTPLRPWWRDVVAGAALLAFFAAIAWLMAIAAVLQTAPRP